MRLIDLRTDLSRLGQRTALHCRRDPLPGKSTAAKHPNPFMPGWLDAEPVPRRPSAGSVGVTPNDDAHPEHMRSLRKSATSGRLRLFFLGGNLPGAAQIQNAAMAMVKPITKIPEDVTVTRSIDQGCPRPPIRSKCRERLSSRYV